RNAKSDIAATSAILAERLGDIASGTRTTIRLVLQRNGTKVGEAWVSGAVKFDSVDLTPNVSESSDSSA
ncbi:hypothetical protein Tco_0594383, partial [Tanacetum coccineum]